MLKTRLVAALLAVLACLATPVLAASRFVSPQQQFTNFAGQPYAGGMLFFYVSGTSTPATTYSDSALTVPNTNPVILDSAGNAGNVFLSPSINYKVILKDANSVQIWAFDPVYPPGTASVVSASWGGTSAGSANALTVTAPSFSLQSGQSIAFIAGLTNTGSATLNPNSLGNILIYKDSVIGPVPLTGGEIIAGNLVNLFYDTSLTGFHFVSPVQVTGIIGEIRTFAFNACPLGWLETNGAAISRTGATANLFAALGTTWGVGDGTTTFNIPALRGKFLRDWDDGAGVDPARAFASTQTGNIAQTVGTSAGTVTGTMSGTATGAGQVLELTSGSLNASGGSNVNTQSALTVTGTITGTETGTATVGTGTDTRPINAAVLFCIKQ